MEALSKEEVHAHLSVYDGYDRLGFDSMLWSQTKDVIRRRG